MEDPEPEVLEDEGWYRIRFDLGDEKPDYVAIGKWDQNSEKFDISKTIGATATDGMSVLLSAVNEAKRTANPEI